MDQLTAMRVFTMIAKNRSFKAAAAEIFGAVPKWDKQTDENKAAALRASL